MAKIQIEVTKAALKKIDKLGIKYTVVSDDIELREFLINNVDDLDEHEQEEIFNAAIEAIKKGSDYGISIETRSGRDMNDERCYTLDEVKIVSSDVADITVDQMLKAS